MTIKTCSMPIEISFQLPGYLAAIITPTWNNLSKLPAPSLTGFLGSYPLVV
jgi:hypothetical protein